MENRSDGGSATTIEVASPSLAHRLAQATELLEEIGIPLTPVRLKCALLGLGVLKVALHK